MGSSPIDRTRQESDPVFPIRRDRISFFAGYLSYPGYFLTALQNFTDRCRCLRSVVAVRKTAEEEPDIFKIAALYSGKEKRYNLI